MNLIIVYDHAIVVIYRISVLLTSCVGTTANPYPDSQDAHSKWEDSLFRVYFHTYKRTVGMNSHNIFGHLKMFRHGKVQEGVAS